MGTTVNISSLLTEFKSVRISSVADKRSLANHIADLEKAWKLGNTDDAKRHATNVQKIAKKYKDRFTVECIKTIESISSGECVPPTPASSPRPVSAFSSRGKSEMTPTRRLANEKNPKTDGMGSGRKTTVHEQQQRAMGVQGIRLKAQQRPSETIMTQLLQVIRTRIEELAAAMRPHPNDENNSNSKSEHCNTLVEIILNQSAEMLNVYRQEKASCNRIHVEHATIRQGLKSICDAFINANTENMETIEMIEELGECLQAKYVRISDTENRLKEMFRNATGREYKGPGNKGGKGTKYNRTDQVKVFQQLIVDMDRQLVDYTSQQDRIHKDTVKSKDELENLQKRISDTEKRLKDMFRHVTGQNYKESSNKDGKRKQENHPYPIEILQQTIYDLEKQLVDYTRMTDTEERLREMFQHVTGREYKGPSILDGKGKETNQYDTVEVLRQMISDMDKQLVDFTSDGMVSGRKANSDDRQQSAGMVPGRKAIIDQTHQREIEGHIQLDLIRQRLKPICAEVLNVDMDGMDTIQMIERLGEILKKQNVRTKLDTSQDSEQRQFQLDREAWLKRINDTEDKLKEMVEQVTQLKKAAVGSKFK